MIAHNCVPFCAKFSEIKKKGEKKTDDLFITEYIWTNERQHNKNESLNIKNEEIHTQKRNMHK